MNACNLQSLRRRIFKKLGFRDSDWGDWKNLNNPEQTPRYRAIEALRLEYHPFGGILDLGCGEGRVLEEIHKSGVSKGGYCGIDFQSEAIRLANDKVQNPNLEKFIQGDISDLSFIDRESFDIILFNEVLYYLKDPKKDPVDLMKRYEAHLNPHGIFLVSICQDLTGSKELNDMVWKNVEETYGSRRLAYNFIKRDFQHGWRIGIYKPSQQI